MNAGARKFEAARGERFFRTSRENLGRVAHRAKPACERSSSPPASGIPRGFASFLGHPRAFSDLTGVSESALPTDSPTIRGYECVTI